VTENSIPGEFRAILGGCLSDTGRRKGEGMNGQSDEGFQGCRELSKKSATSCQHALASQPFRHFKAQCQKEYNYQLMLANLTSFFSKKLPWYMTKQ
jgi:hypothetical protein